MSDGLNSTKNFIQDILLRRGRSTVGGQSVGMAIELSGGKLVPIQHYEPDPITSHDEYYYNSTHNVLYKRVFSVNKPQRGELVAFWQRVS